MDDVGQKEKKGESYWQLVWQQLKRNRLAMMGGFWVIVTLTCLALFADFLANEKPYYIKIHGTSYFPIFRDYLVSTGLAQWPTELVNVDYKTLQHTAALFPPIPYLPNRIDLTA